MKFTEETILKYLDGLLSREEEASLLEAIQLDPQLNELLSRHAQMHDDLQKQSLEVPPENFAKRVMGSIESMEIAKARFFNKGRLFVIGLVGIILLSTAYYLSMKFYPSFGGVLAPEVTLRQFTFNLNPARTFLSSDALFKVVFYVNGVIGLLLLERAVLKPYFDRRKDRISI